MENKWYWSLVLSVILFFGLNAQDRLPASQVFAYIETHYHVKVSYIEDDMQDISFVLPSGELTIDDIIAHINDQPLLACKKVGENSIVVRRIDELLSICGYIKDAENTRALIGATVESFQGQMYTTTDAKGYFELKDLPVGAKIFIRYLGYKTISLTVLDLKKNGEECNSIALQPEYLELNEIVLRNLFTTGLYKKADGSVVISKDDFGLLPGLVNPDVLQTIQELPGIESVNESIADINIRGGSNDQNYISWEGIKMYQSGHFFGLISAFNPQITEKVTIVKNGTSAQYSDGVSGSILMEADQEVQSRFGGRIGSDMLATGVLLDIPLSKRMSLSITGRQSLTQWFDSPTYTKYFSRSFQGSAIQDSNTEQDTDFRFNDISAKWIYKFKEKHKISISFIQLSNKLNYQENTQEKEQESNLTQKSIGGSGHIKSKWTPRFHTDLYTYFTKYKLNALDDDITNEQSLYQENEVEEGGLKLNVLYKLSDQIIWLNGYDFKETGILNASYIVNPTYQILQKRINRNHGLYSEISYQGSKNYLKTGVRFNYLETLGRFLVEPRLSYNRKLWAGFSIHLQAELKHQTATQFVDLNEDFLGIENRRWVNSDENIPVIQSKQVSLGVDYKSTKWYMELMGFYKNTDNIISESQGFQGQYQFDNYVGKSEITGIEFLINRKLGHKSTAWLSYTYSDQDFIFKELSPGEFPGNYNVDHSLSIGTSCYLTDNWNVSLGYTWKSGRYYTKPEEGAETVNDGTQYRVNYGQLNAHQLKSYFRLDVSSGYDFYIDNSNLSIKIGVLNLLNRPNELTRYYIVDPDDNDKAIPVTRNALEITPNLSIGYNF